jgi:hypothetical protein
LFIIRLSRLTCRSTSRKLAAMRGRGSSPLRSIVAGGAFVAATAALLLTLSGCDRSGSARNETLQLVSKTNVLLGSFENTSSNLVVGDPGYDLDTIKVPGLGALLNNCRTGTWNAQGIYKNFEPPGGMGFTAELQVWHTNAAEPSKLKWQKQKDPIGVDTGRAGVFDLAHFRDAKIVPAETKWTVNVPGLADREGLWDLYCGEITLSKREAGVIPFGTVSHSGKGDGGYFYSIARDDTGAIVGVWIVFVDDQGRG